MKQEPGKVQFGSFQLAQMDASEGAFAEKLVLVLINFPNEFVEAEADRALAGLLEERQPVWVRTKSMGSVEVSTSPRAGEQLQFLAAAAAAVVRYSWGWDESDAILATVNGLAYRLVVRHATDRSFDVSLLTAA